MQKTKLSKLVATTFAIWLAAVTSCNTVENQTPTGPEPGSSLPAETHEDYDAKLALIREEGTACDPWMWISVGVCGDMLYITETTGYTGQTSYYDRDTREFVTIDYFTDVNTMNKSTPADCKHSRPSETFCLDK